MKRMVEKCINMVCIEGGMDRTGWEIEWMDEDGMGIGVNYQLL